MTNTADMEQRIITAAITCIERVGIRSATVRRIAEEAGVNVAAINYYFRSKEQLMERAMDTTLNNAFDWEHFIETESAPPKERLVAILEHLTAGAQAFPEITRAHFITPLVEHQTDALPYHRFREFMERLYDDLVSRGVNSGEELRTAILQAVTASILGIGLLLDFSVGFAPRDLTDPEVRHSYLARLVDRIL